MRFTILRFGSLYGPRSNYQNGLYKIVYDYLKNKHISYFGSKNTIREYIHIRDAATSCVDILNKKFINKVVVITGKNKIYVKKLLSIFSGLLKYNKALNYHNEALLVMSRIITKSNPNAMNEQNRKGAMYRASAMHTRALIAVKNENIDAAVGLLKTSARIFYNTLGKDKKQLIECYQELIKQALHVNDLELANSIKKKLKKLNKGI